MPCSRVQSSRGPVQSPEAACPLHVAPQPVLEASVGTTVCRDTCSRGAAARWVIPTRSVPRRHAHLGTRECSQCWSGLIWSSHATRIASYETTSALATLPGPEVGMVPTNLVLRHLSQLGLRVNWEKSKLSPLPGGTCPSSAELPEFLQRQECGTTAPGASETVSVVPHSCICRNSGSSALLGHVPPWGMPSYSPSLTPHREKSLLFSQLTQSPNWLRCQSTKFLGSPNCSLDWARISQSSR